MDHLALPRTPIHPIFAIRMREATPYDDTDFIAYPDHQGWGERSVQQWLGVFQRPTKSFTAFLERWLLFGPMCTVLGDLYKPADFLHFDGDSPNPIVTTQRLSIILQRFTEMFHSSQDYHLNGAVVASCLNCAIRLHLRLMGAGGSREVDHQFLSHTIPLEEFLNMYFDSIRDPRDPLIALATSIISEALVDALSLPQNSFSQDQVPIPTMNAMGGEKSHLWAMLREDGWCPSELSRLFSQFNSACLYFIYNLRRPRAHEVHHVVPVSKDPGSGPPTQLCTPIGCAHRDICEAEYRTTHVDGCHGCQDMVANLEELCQILQRGKIPLITPIEPNDEDLGIELVEAEPGLAYVAISHVWSDGLGNLERNALPRCQLLRLSHLARNLPGKHSNIPLFWCDTICVPPDSAGVTDAQAKAMGLMRDVYACASTTLVLDSWLLGSLKEDRCHAEMLLQIFSCTWNTRLWTYQEGVLAESLYFQFKDGPYDLDAGVKQLQRTADLKTKQTLVRPLVVKYHHLRGFRNQKTKGAKLRAIANELAYRTTSVPSDEPLCLAVLLGLEVEDISQTKPTLRMQKVWKMLSSVPRDLLFQQNTTFDTDGLRWAPTTFLRSHTKVTNQGTPSGFEMITPQNFQVYRGKRGVFINCAGIIVDTKRGPFKDFFYIRDQHKIWRQVIVRSGLVDRSSTYAKKDTMPSLHANTPSEIFGYRRVAILHDEIPEGVSAVEAAFLSTRDDSAKFSRAILVGIYGEKSGTIYCRRITHCTLERFSRLRMSRTVRGLDQAIPVRLTYRNSDGYPETHGAMLAVDGKSMPRSQRWCVG